MKANAQRDLVVVGGWPEPSNWTNTKHRTAAAQAQLKIVEDVEREVLAKVAEKLKKGRPREGDIEKRAAFELKAMCAAIQGPLSFKRHSEVRRNADHVDRIRKRLRAEMKIHARRHRELHALGFGDDGDCEVAHERNAAGRSDDSDATDQTEGECHQVVCRGHDPEVTAHAEYVRSLRLGLASAEMNLHFDLDLSRDAHRTDRIEAIGWLRNAGATPKEIVRVSLNRKSLPCRASMLREQQQRLWQALLDDRKRTNKEVEVALEIAEGDAEEVLTMKPKKKPSRKKAGAAKR